MFALALRSLRHRPGRLVSTLLATTLGAGVVMAFLSLADTSAAAGTDDTSSETLGITSNVVGGYGTLLVFFAVASTLTVNVRQRAEELSLLRSVGATPRQIGRLVLGEAVAVALLGGVLAILPAMLGGRLLLGMFKDSGQVADDVAYTYGGLALGGGFGTVVLASAGAALLALRRSRKALPENSGRIGRGRALAGFAALVVGLGATASTFSVDRTEPGLMAAPAYGAILLSLGLATLAPAVLHRVLGLCAPLLGALGGAGGHLSAQTLRAGATRASAVLAPLVTFTGMATATLYIQGVESEVRAASGVRPSVDDKNLETLNYVVVGVIVAFCCLMLINSLYAATTYRRREFGQHRLAGATPRQVLTLAAYESLILTGTGILLGTAAALAGIVPFTRVRTGAALLPDSGPGIWLLVAAIATVATFATTLGTARRVLRVPAVRAVAGGE